MNREEAKRILILYRPNSRDAEDAEMAEALRAVQEDEELKKWFEQHCAFQDRMRRAFRESPVPTGVRERILPAKQPVRVRFGRRTVIALAAAAAVVLSLGLAALLMPSKKYDRFEDYRERMVQTVLREYRMDLVTGNAEEIRQFLAAQGAPADYTLPQGLAELQTIGAGSLKWRGHPVSMVCFERTDDQMVFLFVTGRTAARQAPPSAPQFEEVHNLMTASWSDGDRVYLVAGPDEPEFARKYLKRGG